MWEISRGWKGSLPFAEEASFHGGKGHLHTPKEGKAQGAAAAPTGGFKLSRPNYMKKKDGSGD